MDGFRFDLASCLCRDPQGVPMDVPPLIRDIAMDPVLSKVSLPAVAGYTYFLIRNAESFLHACSLSVCAQSA